MKVQAIYPKNQTLINDAHEAYTDYLHYLNLCMEAHSLDDPIKFFTNDRKCIEARDRYHDIMNKLPRREVLNYVTITNK